MNRLEFNVLFDIYGDLLTKRQKEICSLYFEEDFSYTEISEALEISRAAVQDSLKKSMQQLHKYEDIIQYVSKRKRIVSLLKDLDDDKIKEEILSIL
ncbi:DNA-binding protein [Faecalicoccus pleomorphus]|uniref:sigma factor-like helix-turn-helix DNA-binding protein n=1 Tax=Faecalicoccus pleomorphus TaxID=1323 RepID=UPI00195F5C11|nr:sigma factor-like helix-turn-helix DNA-binding protein [Faecalicoccus pleomorphus]MBM6678829.1 DNA-binding protein [Faecalicoccus pleomorphus]